MCNEEPDLPRRIVFTDECTFTLHHPPNKQNYREWSKTNPHNVHASNSQYPATVNVWAGIVDHTIVGPFFIQGTLTGEKYLELLQTEIAPAVANLNIEQEIWYLHDGCPAHNYGPAVEFLHEAFPGHVIGTHEALQWPPRSPDLNPPDSFLWGHIKSKIYGMTPFADVVALRAAIEECCANITHVELRSVMSHFYDCLGYCVAADGGRFEHLIA
jgi:hypothetical protein